jgi:alkylhydroperoxidase family enzyme
MARLPYLDRSDLQPEHQDLLKRNINLHRLLVHSPVAMRAWNQFAHFIRHESRLDPRLRELAILQVGYLERSPYEYSHHVKIGREFGVSDDDIRAIAEETEGRPSSLDPLDKAVLRAAREMTHGLSISERTFQELSQSLDNERLTDLVLTIAFYNSVVRILATLQIDVEDEYQPYLQEFPLPRTRALPRLPSRASRERGITIQGMMRS